MRFSAWLSKHHKNGWKWGTITHPQCSYLPTYPPPSKLVHYYIIPESFMFLLYFVGELWKRRIREKQFNSKKLVPPPPPPPLHFIVYFITLLEGSWGGGFVIINTRNSRTLPMAGTWKEEYPERGECRTNRNEARSNKCGGGGNISYINI